MQWPLTRLFFVALLFWGCSDAPDNAGTTSNTVPGPISDAGRDDIDGEIDLCVPADCDDGNPCTLNGCNEGACYTEPLGGQPCTDDNECTVNTNCLDDGSCAGGKVIVCEDGDPCTNDICLPSEGCIFETADDGSPCSDGNPCTFPDGCSSGECVGTAVDCEEDEEGCMVFTGCEPDDGSCIYSPKTEGSVCNDGDLCSDGDSCKEGKCLAGQPVLCEDNNPCTDDLCSPKSGCMFTPNQSVCDDGDLCTQGDLCSFGSCSGEPINCDDGKICTFEACDSASGDCIVTTPAIPCDDGNLCTVGDTCIDGICTSGEPQPCDDQNPCTTDACSLETGECSFMPNENPCDDGNQCTDSDECASGSCNGTPVTCNDGNECTSDTCDGELGCQYSPLNGACDDGDLCSSGEVCENGQCKNGVSVLCDDNNPCTADSCNPDTGLCTFSDVPGTCDDGNACTTEDKCDDGACSGSTIECDDDNVCTDDSCAEEEGCSHEPNTASCNDNDNCTLDDTCLNGSCQSGKTPLCDDGNECTFDLCNGETEECGTIPQPGECDDGNACTENDTCAGGECTGSDVSTEDNNPCTDDKCDPVNGVTHTPNTSSCDDGNLCTPQDACSGGNCEGVGSLECNDQNPCTTDTCDSLAGCVHTPNSAECSDGDQCTSGDQCTLGVCAPGPALNCDDNSPCTTEVCLPESGCQYTNVANVCDDGDPCTEGDTCLGGSCIGGFPIACDDENPCTSEECVSGVGCVTSPLEGDCDDQNVCTLNDTCSNGFCVSSESLNCDDKNPCTNNLCSATDGCAYINNSDNCDDGDACTGDDSCDESVCEGVDITCDDGNDCTDDSCDSTTGCVFTPNTAPCDDGDACTVEDNCAVGACAGTPAEPCDDNNVCTEDLCAPDTGCEFAVQEGPCDDGNACTSSDQCSGGQCVGGPTVNCNDNNDCTAESCDADLGCKYFYLSDPCNDGDACTTSDACLDGECSGSSGPPCDDGNGCTDDSCEPSVGCVFSSNTSGCSDGDLCTTTDLCSNGMCTGSGELDCTDNNECTQDTCDPDSGCNSEPLNQSCNDGNACTENDFCDNGNCASNTPVICDDNNGCTIDACDGAVGCTHQPATGPCDDGDLCTAEDTCMAGQCIGVTQVLCDDCDNCTEDTCDALLGCVHTIAPLPCSDGDGCTVNDVCEGGTCVGTTCEDAGLQCSGTQCSPEITQCFSLELKGDGEGVTFATQHMDEAFTIEFVVWLDQLSQAPASTHLLYIDGPNDKLLLKAQSNGQWSVSWGPTGEESPLTWNAIGQNAALLNQWIHVAVVYDDATGSRSLFIDGTEKASDSGMPSFSGGGLSQGSLGKGPTPFVAYPTVEGRFRWARISSTARNPVQFSATKFPTEADAWTENLFLMKERNDGVLADSSFYWRHGSLSGGAWLALDGTPIIDADHDGYSPCEGDCDDSDGLIHPGRGEICGDAIDNDCDGTVDVRDYDGDGWEGCSGQDCNDFAASVFPGAPELLGDGLDNNCDSISDGLDSDDDLDGWNENQGDCNDGAPHINPAAQEVPDNGIDEDCTGADESLEDLLNPVIYVDGNLGSDFFDGSQQFPKKTINGALSIAEVSDVIAVQAATYAENIELKGAHLVGGYGVDWLPSDAHSEIAGNISTSPLTPTSAVLSRVSVTGSIVAGVSSGLTALDVDVTSLSGPAITTDSKLWIIADATLRGAGEAPSAETGTVRSGTGGVSLWNSTLIAGSGMDGETGETGICCGIGVSAGTPGGIGESVYAIQTSYDVEQNCCDPDGDKPGCGVSLCEECVCAQSPSCCSDGWSNECVEIAQSIPCSLLGCNGCPGPEVQESIISATLLQGGRAGDGGQGGNAFNNNYACGPAGDGGNAITFAMEQVRVQGSAVISGVAGDGASQVNTTGYSSSCSGGNGGISLGIDAKNTTLEQVTVAVEVRPGQSLGGQPAEPLSESPQGPQTFSTGLGGILQGVVLEGASTGKHCDVRLAANSGTLRSVQGVQLKDGKFEASRVRIRSASAADGVALFDSTSLLNTIIHHLLYPGVGVAVEGTGTTISSSTVVVENPGNAVVWKEGTAGGTLVNSIAVTGDGGICLVNEGDPLAAIHHNLLDGCTEQLYFDGLFRTQALELDFLLGNGNSGGHLFTDPGFEGATEGNFALASCSPAIDAGLDASYLTFGGILTDIDGEGRPYGVSHDIGADEYTPATIEN